MVLDNRTYDQLAGKWRDLFDRMKWDIIKSVIKSVSGLQGKKVKVSQPLPCARPLVDYTAILFPVIKNYSMVTGL